MIKIDYMKRFLNLTLFAASALAVLASCQREPMDPAFSPDGEGNVSITLNLDGKISTKADGSTSSLTVYYEIYDDSDFDNRIYPSSGSGFPVADMENAVKVSDDGKAYINIELLKGKEYRFVFWAMEENAPYTWTSLTDISMNWSEVGNADRDAFYGTVAVRGGESASVTLVRPFAQLNIGADQRDMVCDPSDGTPLVVTSWAVGYPQYHPYKSSKIQVTGEFADTFNAATAEATSSESVSTLAFLAEGLYGNIEQGDLLSVDRLGLYVYVAMNYLLPVSSSTGGIYCTADVTMEFKVGDAEPISHVLTSVPFNANKRTNLVGRLFNRGELITVELSSWEDDDEVVPLESARR